MLRRLFVNSTGIALVVLGCFSFSSPAFAGFQWVPPADDMAAAPAPAPAESSSTGFSSPVVVGSPALSPTSSSLAPIPVNPTIISSGKSSSGVLTPPPTLETAPTPIVTSSRITAPVALSPSSIPSSDSLTLDQGNETTIYSGAPSAPSAEMASSPGEVVHGFAKNVPLVVALRQILPVGYTYSIDKNVDMSTLVSFQGGKPWRETLGSTLVPAGLVMNERGQTVQIGYAGDDKTKAAGFSDQPSMNSRSMGSSFGGVTEISSANAPLRVTPKPDVQISSPSSLSVSETNGTWIAERGETLHKVLGEWCERARVEFNWVAEYDYPIDASVSFNGSFQEAVRSLLTGFEAAHPQPVAELHANATAGEQVLVVRTRGNTDTD